MSWTSEPWIDYKERIDEDELEDEIFENVSKSL